MSAMKYRDDNKVLWRGIRPAHNGNQIIKRVSVVNGSSIVHTVSAGKTLYLTQWRFSSQTTVAGLYGNIHVRDGGDVILYYMDDILMAAIGEYGNAVGLFFPIEIPAGYDVVVQSSGVGLDARGFIHGFEE